MRIIFVILIFISTSVTFTQPIHLTAKTAVDTFQLGSWIDVQVEGKMDATIDTIGPVVKDSIGVLEVVKIERQHAEPTWLIRLTTIDSGKVFLPPIEFAYKIKGV